MTGSPSERDSLPAHVDLCALRYKAMEDRLKRLEYLMYAVLIALGATSEPVLAVLKAVLK